jgi:ABC-type nitrate/sulfonate/bicarbonate transport system substrate-binding protein
MMKIGAIVAAVWLLAACGAPPPAAPTTGSPATPQPATAAPTTASAVNGQLTEIRIGLTGNTADAPLFIAQDRGYFKEQGLKLAYTRVQSANDVVAPLGAGQLEVGGGAISAGLFNAIARGIDVRIVADKGQHSGSPVNGFTSAVVLTVPKQDADVYKTLADVKGKTVSLASTGSGNEIMLDRGLQSVGLSNKDVNIKTLSFADGLAALSTHSVDLAVEIEPFVAQGVAKGILVPWLKSEELYAGQQGGVLVFGPGINKLGSDVGDRFMTAYIKGIRDYYDAFGVKHTDQDAIAAILANNTDVKDVALYAKMGWDLIDPDGYVNGPAVADDLEWYVAHDYVQQKPDISRVIDNSYVEHALAVLGKYQP